MGTVADALARPANGFAAVRLGLALAVVVSHAFSVTSGRIADEPLHRLTGFTLGEHAVNGFFAISGFLVTMSFLRRGWRDYAVARALRIAPGLLAATFAVTFGLGLVFTRLSAPDYLGDPATWRFVQMTLTAFKSNAALPGLFADNPFRFPMGTVWTLKYEVLCYLGVLAVGLAGALRPGWFASTVLGGLFVALLGLVLLHPDPPLGVVTALRLPLVFASGAALYLWRDRVPMFGLAALGLFAAAATLSGTFAYQAMLLVATAYGIVWLCLSPALARPAFAWDMDLSYGTYLYGWPIQQALRQAFPTASSLSLLAPALVLTLSVAALSWRLVEGPALALKARILGPARPHPSAPAPP
jgi:peptidoglycan/LPS O-acetylase OafA/YrhL